MSGRKRRVNEAIRQVLSDTIPTLKDPRIGFVTVTGVEAATGYAHATVFVSVFGSEKEQERTLEGLKAAHGVLQAQVARELRLRRTPVLSFEYDPTVERGVRLGKMIDELAPRTAMANAKTDDMAAVVAALGENERFLVAAHENPDGDALGSLLATHLALRQLGKESTMFVAGQAPLPGEYTFLPLDDVQRELPADHAQCVLVAVDCAKEERLGPDSSLLEQSPFTIDIDHHHDNTRFGDVNLIVADASSTGEILADVFRELGVEITPEIAEPLYVALVTDTGRFQYANTSSKALRLAADLIDAGADWHKVFQTVYENVQFAKLKLLARALERAEVYSGGRLVISHLRKSDFAEVGAAEPYSEGIIDYLRAVEGAMVAALIREPPRGDGPTHRVSLRASVDEIDVSVIARKSDGGGHRQAAGFSSELSLDELKRFIVEEFKLAAAGESSLHADRPSRGG